MKKIIPINICFILVCVLFQSCCSSYKVPTIKKYAEITTNCGIFVVGLYEQTPYHRDNFILNCSNNRYNNTILYSAKKDYSYSFGLRPGFVENSFLSTNFHAGKVVEPELSKNIIPKKGTVAMCSYDAASNKNCYSDEMLFFIVHGSDNIADYLLNLNVARRNKDTYKKYIQKYLAQAENKYLKDSLDALHTLQTSQEYNKLYAEIMQKVKPQIIKDGVLLYSMSEKARETYKTKGGLPQLEGKFTFLGEIVYGIDILNVFSQLKTDKSNLPQNDVQIISTSILSKKEYKNKYKN